MDTLTLTELYTLHRRAVWSVSYVLLLNKEMPGAWLGQWHWGQRGDTFQEANSQNGAPGRLEGAAGVPGNSGGSGLWGGGGRGSTTTKQARQGRGGARNSPT